MRHAKDGEKLRKTKLLLEIQQQYSTRRQAEINFTCLHSSPLPISMDEPRQKSSLVPQKPAILRDAQTFPDDHTAAPAEQT